MKRKIIKVVVCFILVITMVYYIPMPIHINATLQGIQREDTATDNFVNILVKGWHLNYLFRSNKIKGTLTITPYNYEKANNAVYEFMGDIFASSEDTNMQWSTMTRYSANLNCYVNGTVFFDKNFENVVITESENKGYYYIPSDKTQDEIDAIFDYFKLHLD